jgi:hypothetical protein
MAGLFSFLLDLILIGLLITGIYYAIRLSRQIAGLRASREEMERFVLDFRTTVERAEAGIRGLKQVARTSGDDLEQLIEKAHSMRDELQFLVESADRLADRLSGSPKPTPRSPTPERAAVVELSKPAAPVQSELAAESGKKAALSSGATSAAEKELLQALQKLG